METRQGESIFGDCENGTGIFRYSDGKMYEGQWKNNKPHGQGIGTWPDGSKYYGQFENGKFNGQGTMLAPDGSKYIGQWKDGNQYGYGYGTLIEETGDPEFPKRIHSGVFENGLHNGYGNWLIYDQFGNLRGNYAGPFKEGKRFGKGATCFYDMEGEITKTESGWYDGEFLGENKSVGP